MLNVCLTQLWDPSSKFPSDQNQDYAGQHFLRRHTNVPHADVILIQPDGMQQTESQVALGCLQPLNSHLSLASVPDLRVSCLLGKTFRTGHTGELSTPLAFSKPQAKAATRHYPRTLLVSSLLCCIQPI